MKNILITFIVAALSLGIWFYFDQDKEATELVVEEKVEQEEVIDLTDVVRCPNDDYSWEKLHFVGKDEITIECKVGDDDQIILVAKKNDEGLLRYQVSLEYNDKIILLGSYGLYYRRGTV